MLLWKIKERLPHMKKHLIFERNASETPQIPRDSMGPFLSCLVCKHLRSSVVLGETPAACKVCHQKSVLTSGYMWHAHAKDNSAAPK